VNDAERIADQEKTIASLLAQREAQGKRIQELERPADVRVEHHGTVLVLVPISDEATAWIESNIGSDAALYNGGLQPIWPAVVVEFHYAVSIISRIKADGLKVTFS
jgi:hypothetical protein